jgi:hypothetical protein
MKYRKILASLFSVVLVGGFLLAGGVSVSADDGQPARADTIMTLQQKMQTDRTGAEYMVLTAKLTQADGYPLSERYINFYEDINVLGEGLLAIGTAQTSAAGIATLRYETKMLGEHNVSAIYSGDAISMSAQATAKFTLTQLPNGGFQEDATGMEQISSVALMAIGGVVVIIIGVLLGVVLGTYRGIAGNHKSA